MVKRTLTVTIRTPSYSVYETLRVIYYIVYVYANIYNIDTGFEKQMIRMNAISQISE